MNNVDSDTISKLATLSKLKINDDEKLEIGIQFNKILDMINQLHDVPDDSILDASDNHINLREDSHHSEENLDLTKFEQYSTDYNCFLVPKVVDLKEDN